MAVNIFNTNFYRAANPDLASFNDTQAWSHFQTYGLNEGRVFSPLVDLNFYRANNGDLAAFSNRQAYEHLQTFGVAEGRNFSPLVDLNFYRASNSDLATFNNEQLFQHLQTFGVAEGRNFSPLVDLNFYRASNSDLATFNNEQLFQHLQTFGISEGRRFSPYFDVNFYRSYYGDLSGLSSSQAFQHYIVYGQKEGRIGNNPNQSPFNIQFDYQFDTNGFFSDPNRRNVLEAAATIWENLIKDEFTNIPISTDFYITNPQTGANVQLVSNYEVDDLVVFVGAMNMGNTNATLAEGGPSAIYYEGSSLDSRFNSLTNFEPWTGSISFNSATSWFFDSTPTTSHDIPANSMDFLSVAVHELGHVLGIGTSDAFANLVSGSYFSGSRARAVNGNNPIPLEPDLGHVQDNFFVNGVGPEAAMDPLITQGTRNLPTPLDMAILADIGYQV